MIMVAADPGGMMYAGQNRMPNPSAPAPDVATCRYAARLKIHSWKWSRTYAVDMARALMVKGTDGTEQRVRSCGGSGNGVGGAGLGPPRWLP